SRRCNRTSRETSTARNNSLGGSAVPARLTTTALTSRGASPATSMSSWRSCRWTAASRNPAARRARCSAGTHSPSDRFWSAATSVTPKSIPPSALASRIAPPPPVGQHLTQHTLSLRPLGLRKRLPAIAPQDAAGRETHDPRRRSGPLDDLPVGSDRDDAHVEAVEQGSRVHREGRDARKAP